jgi:hypothetical protein
MRASTLSLFFLLSPTTLTFTTLPTATPLRPTPTPSTCAFEPAVSASLPLQQILLQHLQIRQNSNNCPADYIPCTNLGVSTICCSNNAICTPDFAQHIACCPSGAQCTGTIGAIGTANTGGVIVNTITVGGSTTTFNGFAAPSTTGAPSQQAQSTVPNSYFPFLYIPTTFSNAAICSSYFTSCGNEFSSCTSQLGGNVVNGVTVAGPGGAGVTVIGVSAVGSQSAQSICSSLSSQGCYGLQLSNCPQFGTDVAAGGTPVVTVVGRATIGRRRIGVAEGVVEGLVLALAGWLM